MCDSDLFCADISAVTNILYITLYINVKIVDLFLYI